MGFNEDLKSLKKTSSIAEAMEKAREMIKELAKLKAEDKGKLPDPLRYPGRGQKGELWFRNRLFWLRTIPLDGDSAFIATHSEPSASQSDRRGRCPSDLLGLFRGKIDNSITTALAIAELKAGGKGDHLIYAVMQASRNAVLQEKGLERLAKGWKKNVTSKKGKGEGELPFWNRVWGKGNPFGKLSEGVVVVLIIGDKPWFDAQKKYLEPVCELRKELKELKEKIPLLHILFYQLADNAKHDSKPYALLPLGRIE